MCDADAAIAALQRDVEQACAVRDEVRAAAGHVPVTSPQVLPRLAAERAGLEQTLARRDVQQRADLEDYRSRAERAKRAFQATCDRRAQAAVHQAADTAIGTLSINAKVGGCRSGRGGDACRRRTRTGRGCSKKCACIRWSTRASTSSAACSRPATWR